MNTSEVLNRAADEIEGRGWLQGPEVDGWWPEPDSTNPVCMEGGINAACEEPGDRSRAKCALSAYLTAAYPEFINSSLGRVIPFSWNDRPERTAEQVIATLRAAAVIESAKETADERESVAV